ncbi:hypothetical protein C0989_005456 [Termitomyces sp. Mn162]|nr:hypothetical protein C0989_005456 [Termitomyces sp. Mn162]
MQSAKPTSTTLAVTPAIAVLPPPKSTTATGLSMSSSKSPSIDQATGAPPLASATMEIQCKPATTVNEPHIQMGAPGLHAPPVPSGSEGAPATAAGTKNTVALPQPLCHTKTGQDLINNFSPSSINHSTASQPAPVDGPEDQPLSSSGQFNDAVMDKDPYFGEGSYSTPYSVEMYSDDNYAMNSGQYMSYNHHEAPYNPPLQYHTNGAPP